MALMALGVVFGDIGTSPLYAFSTALALVGRESAVGVASLVLWTIFLVVTVKYATVIMRADYKGEGGIFALTALLRDSGGVPLGVLMPVAVVGAALLLGDGAITPAISVLSAVEGMAVLNSAWGGWAMPVAMGILGLLFLFQTFGTARLGGVFGPVMLLWFGVLAAMGLRQVVRVPEVLAAFDPREGIGLLLQAGWGAWALVGAVVLAITGAEALFADLGHFGRIPILRAWRFIVFPSLILNYLGQAGLVLRDASAATNPNLFFLMAPEGGLRVGLVVLATAATVIASQALISATFSLASQAMDLGLLPRFFVRHTSRALRGQLYVPVVNFLLGAVCLMLVLVFRTSSALANAYGIAVTGAMIVTTLVFGAVVFSRGTAPRWQAALLVGGLLCLDLPLFGSCLTKLFDGGLAPVLLGASVAAVMLTWRKGRMLVRQKMQYGAVSVEELGKKLATEEFGRVAGTAIYVVRRPSPEHAVSAILEQYRRVKVLYTTVVILLLDSDWGDPMEVVGGVRVERYEGGLWVVRGEHGYMVEPDAPAMMEQACALSGGELSYRVEDAFFVVTRLVIVECPARMMRSWQRQLFGFMTRNVVVGTNFLAIPPDRLVVYNWLLRL